MNHQKLLALLLIGFLQACNTSSSNASTPAKSVTTPTAQLEATSETQRQSSEPQIAERPPKTDLPAYCSPENYRDFFAAFVAGRDYQGNEVRATYTADRIEVRNYDNPDQLLEVLRRQDDEFSINSRDYRWVQLVPSSVDNSPYTRLKIDIRRLSNDTFRVDYIKAQYKYTGDQTGTESEELVQTYGNPAAYLFQHRNGCWNLIQKLRSLKPESPAQSNLPFVGKRYFYSSDGRVSERYAITIAADGTTLIESNYAKMRDWNVLYQGSFQEKMTFRNGLGVKIADGKAYFLDVKGEVTMGCSHEDQPCTSELTQ